MDGDFRTQFVRDPAALKHYPALVLNARNDPFVPGSSLPNAQEVGRFVTLWQPEHGGHVGFPDGRWPGHVYTMPEAVGGWLVDHMS